MRNADELTDEELDALVERVLAEAEAGWISVGQPCAVCGTPFVPRRPWATFCSGACRQRAYRDRRRSVRVDG